MKFFKAISFGIFCFLAPSGTSVFVGIGWFFVEVVLPGFLRQESKYR